MYFGHTQTPQAQLITAMMYIQAQSSAWLCSLTSSEWSTQTNIHILLAANQQAIQALIDSIQCTHTNTHTHTHKQPQTDFTYK